MSDDGWHPDPTGRHQYRWFANGEWADSVWDQGVAGTDPISPIGGPGAVVDNESTIARSDLAPAAPTAPDVAPVAPAIEPTAPVAPAAVPTFAAAPSFPVAGVPGTPAGGLPIAPVAVTAKIPPMERFRTGVPGPVAWAAAMLAAPGFALLLGGIFALFLAGAINDVDNSFGGSDFGDDASGAASGVGLVYLVIGGFYLTAAIGLMMLVPWTRVAAIVLGCLHGVSALLVLGQAAEPGILLLAVAATQVFLLFTPTAQQAFKHRPTRLTEVAQPFRS